MYELFSVKHSIKQMLMLKLLFMFIHISLVHEDKNYFQNLLRPIGPANKLITTHF